MTTANSTKLEESSGGRFEHQTPRQARLAILPSEWRMATLGEVVASMKNGIYKPRDAYAEDGIACLRMYNIDQGRIVWKDIKRMRISPDELQEYGLEAGDVLVNRVNSRELVGKAATIPVGIGRCVFESKNIRIRLKTDLVDPRFVSFALLAMGRSYFNRNAQQVVGMASINQPQVAGFPLPLPQLVEQRRIVAEIEKHFTRLEAGVASLEQVQIVLKRYRASVLKAACEGRLVPTEAELARRGGRSYEPATDLLRSILSERRMQWESSELLKLKAEGKSSIGDKWKAKYPEPRKAPPSISGSEELTKGWTWVRLEELGFTFGGLTKNPKRAKLPNKFPYLRVANVYANELRLNEIEEIGVDSSELEKLLVKTGDLLIVEGNGSKDQIGRLAIWDGSISPCVHQNHLIKVRLATVALSKWVLLWLLSPRGRHFIQQVASSTSGLYTLSVNKVGELPIALPPLAEQQRIVAEVEHRLSIVEELEATAMANLKRAERLRQSVLHRAFSGQL